MSNNEQGEKQMSTGVKIGIAGLIIAVMGSFIPGKISGFPVMMGLITMAVGLGKTLHEVIKTEPEVRCENFTDEVQRCSCDVKQK